MSETKIRYGHGLPGFFDIPEDLRTKGTVLYAVDKNGFTKLVTSCGQVCLQGKGTRQFNIGLDDYLNDFTTRADKEGISAILTLDEESSQAMENVGLFKGYTHLGGTSGNPRTIGVYKLDQ